MLSAMLIIQGNTLMPDMIRQCCKNDDSTRLIYPPCTMRYSFVKMDSTQFD